MFTRPKVTRPETETLYLQDRDETEMLHPQDREETETLNLQDRDKTEMFQNVSRPPRDRDVQDRDHIPAPDSQKDRFDRLKRQQIHVRSMERVSVQCCCIPYTIIEIFDCNCNDLELGRFKVIQGQMSWSQSKVRWWFPI